MPTVLIVDDSIAIRTLTSHMLTALNVESVLAEDGQQALEMCKAAMPDGVLLDWNMPVMDGPMFQQRLRALPGGKKPKIIFCTIEDTYEKIAKAISGEAEGFIIKPFTLGTLAYNLERAGIIEKKSPA
ncbi:MAG: response regulator [Rhodospirillaceae bacterium]|nr:response regulator [Rhodospirillaceae bacterium]